MNRYAGVLVWPALLLGACSHQEQAREKASGEQVQGTLYAVRAVSTVDVMRAPAVAEPYASATVSTKLMGAVTAVHVREGDLQACVVSSDVEAIRVGKDIGVAVGAREHADAPAGAAVVDISLQIEADPAAIGGAGRADDGR